MVVLVVIFLVVLVFIMLAFIMLVFIVLGHGQVVGTVLSVEFVCLLSVFGEKMNVRGARRGEVTAQVTEQNGFEIKRFFA